jgi:hypothetical protein
MINGYYSTGTVSQWVMLRLEDYGPHPPPSRVEKVET